MILYQLFFFSQKTRTKQDLKCCQTSSISNLLTCELQFLSTLMVDLMHEDRKDISTVFGLLVITKEMEEKKK